MDKPDKIVSLFEFGLKKFSLPSTPEEFREVERQEAIAMHAERKRQAKALAEKKRLASLNELTKLKPGRPKRKPARPKQRLHAPTPTPKPPPPTLPVAKMNASDFYSLALRVHHQALLLRVGDSTIPPELQNAIKNLDSAARAVIDAAHAQPPTTPQVRATARNLRTLVIDNGGDDLIAALSKE